MPRPGAPRAAKALHFLAQLEDLGRQLRVGVPHVAIEESLARERLVDEQLTSFPKRPLGNQHQLAEATPVGDEGKRPRGVGMLFQGLKVER